MCLWIADECVYAYFNEVVNEMAYKIDFFPVVILVVLGISMFLSLLCESMVKCMGSIINVIPKKEQKTK